MKKHLKSLFAFLLCVSMIAGAFAACTNGSQGGDETTSGSSEESTTGKTEGTTAGRIEDTTAGSGETTVEETTEEPFVLTEGEYAPLVQNAHELKNGVNVYFTDPTRNEYVVKNKNMQLEYMLNADQSQLVTALKSASGKAYVENTMDVYVKTTSGKVYYASESTTQARTNVLKLGYYYYDVRILDQTFFSEFETVSEHKVNLASYDYYADMKKPKVNGGVLKSEVTSNLDTCIAYTVDYNAADYNYVAVTLKVSGTISNANLYMLVGGNTALDEKHKLSFDLLSDGETHTYYIPMSTMPDYTGKVTQLRLDIYGQPGDEFEISEIKAVNAKVAEGAPALYLDRNLNVYSDKLHQTLHFVAGEKVTDIAELGMITDIAVDTVEKLIVKDKNGTHDSLDGVDWASAEYIGFDIKDVGIFGYIMPVHATSGSITVTLTDGNYRIVQSSTPENNTINPPVNDKSNDFYMGQRLYTDESHDFAEFLNEAECERHPLTSENIVVDTENSDNGAFAGYDALRGYYRFTLDGTVSFNYSYFGHQNEHFNVRFTIKGDDLDRKMYINTFADSTNIECGAVLSEKDMLLPIPIEVSKNFIHEKEEPLYDRGDKAFSETFIPVTVKADEEMTLNILNLYQNWGKFPLKQVSSIQACAPYYHLSTGVTESNCICPYYVHGRDLQILPDHRAASGIMWTTVPNHPNGNQPQFTNGGYHYLLRYTDANGNVSALETLSSTVLSAGPTYAEVEMKYLSDDGKIKATYTHMEMPQLDENRTYYTMKLEVLEDVSFENFATDLSFYKMVGFGAYSKVGYLDEQGNAAVKDANTTSKAKVTKLGSNCPYFSYFGLIKGDTNDYVNLACLVYNSSITIGGEKCDAGFVVTDVDDSLSLSLDLEAVTLKAGDVIEINMILLPWGSPKSTDDTNVQNVRNDTLLDPLTVTAGNGTEVIESVYLPRVLSTDGKSAEFTLSGGENNVTVRAYGFNKLTVPKIYEKIDGEWVEYKISSIDSLDDYGNGEFYDGYQVCYDGNGTYSYSFVVDMTGDAERTFRVVADEDFEGWPEKEDVIEQTRYNLTLDANTLMTNASNPNSSIGEVALSDDESYARFFGNGLGETYAHFALSGVTGQYMVVKYRLPESNPESAGHFGVFASTVNPSATGSGDFMVTDAVVKDGEWQVMVIDLAAFNLSTFAPATNGNYSIKFIRFDMFNQTTALTSYIDIEYIAFCDELDDAIAANSDRESITFVNSSSGSEEIPTASAE